MQQYSAQCPAMQSPELEPSPTPAALPSRHSTAVYPHSVSAVAVSAWLRDSGTAACVVAFGQLQLPSSISRVADPTHSTQYTTHSISTESALDQHWISIEISIEISIGSALKSALKSALDQHWISIEISIEISIGSALKSALKSALDQHWISIGSALDQHWISIGSALDQHWISIGSALKSALDQHWISIGSALDQHWISI